MKIYRGFLSQATLDRCFEEAKANDAKYIGVRMELGDQTNFSVIMANDFGTEREYYREKYDNRLCLKSDPDLMRIRAIMWSETFGGLSHLMK